MFASKYGHTNIVQLLLERGADANLQSKVSSSANIVCVCLPYCCAPGIQHNRYSPIYVVVQLARYISCPCFLTKGIH